MPRQPKRRVLDFATLMSIGRVSAPSVSPDGGRAAYVLSTHDPVANKVHHTIHVIELLTKNTFELTPGPGNHTAPAWSPDGAWIAFVSDRDAEAGRQLWVVSTTGGEARRVTDGWGGVGTPSWAPDSKRIAFSREVVVSPDYDPKKDKDTAPGKEPSRAKVMGLANEKSSARVVDDLLFRPWDHWRDRKRAHLFVVDVGTGRMTDLTPWDRDVPPVSLGSERDFDWAPDGREIAYVMNPDTVVARSTNNSIYVQKVNGIRPVGEPVRVSITDACDNHPRYCPTGRRLFYLGMNTPTYEADRMRVRAYDRRTGETKTLLEKFNRSPQSFEVFYDEDDLIVMFIAQDRGRQAVYHLDYEEGSVRQLTHGTHTGLLRHIPHSDMLLVTRESATTPADLFIFAPAWGIEPPPVNGPSPSGILPDAGSSLIRLTDYAKAVADVTMNPAQEFWYPGADGDLVHGFLIRPADFDPHKKYPLMLLIHGGPQSAFLDHWHYRWNPQMFSASGAVVAFLNPRGSTGYGDKFKEQISKDWGGRCFEDVMAGLDHLLATNPFIDKKRIGAAGASFGGFMVNWILGHTDRFKALVCHDGVFFAETMAYTTDELWFDEYEHGGLPHVHRKTFEKFSPHRFVGEFKTPTLVIHGELDFRCPISEGLGLFTALQVMGVPSRFVCFEDEGHWILKPANAEVWYGEVVGWLEKWLGVSG